MAVSLCKFSLRPLPAGGRQYLPKARTHIHDRPVNGQVGHGSHGLVEAVNVRNVAQVLQCSVPEATHV